MLGELSSDQIEHVLRAEVVGRIGCFADGRIYVVPITYAYLDGAVYGHSAGGLKVRMMRKNPSVCFEVDQMDDMTNWRSVIAWGTFEELHGEEGRRGMGVLMQRLAPLMASATSAPDHGRRAGHQAETAASEAVIYRLVLSEKTGRFEKRP